MARKQSWNVGKLNAELTASDAAINPLLESAKITSIKVDGKEVPASEAPLPDRIKAYSDVAKSGATSADAVELAELNGQVTAQLEKASGELALAQASVSTLTQEKSRLTSDLATAQASVTKLTADNAELGSRNTTLAKELESSAGRLNTQKLALARKCVACNAVEFKGADGKALTAEASDADLLAASKELTFDSLMASFSGAVNLAMNKTGVSLFAVPGEKPKAGETKSATEGLTGLERALAAHKSKQAETQAKQ